MPAASVAAPEWLLGFLGGGSLKSLGSCTLRKGEEGAGLDLEASELGYLVEAVEAEPGQDAKLQPGTMVIAIDGVPLLGLDEDALASAFGDRFRDGATILFASAEELRAAVAGQPPRGRLAHVPLSQPCGEAARATLQADLATFAKHTGVSAELCGPPDAPAVGVVLSGPREKLIVARPELGALLAYHGLGAGTAAPRGEKRSAGDSVEVGGLVMQSLPARNRRRRSAAAIEEEAAAEEEQANCDSAGPNGAEGAAADGAEGEKARGDSEPQGKELHQYEYMDHTADVVLHSWGTSLKEAIAQVCVCFFSYMTDLDKLEIVTSVEVEATGHDMVDMLYHLLDEFLFSFGTTFIMCRRVEIVEFDEAALKIRAKGWGEKFSLEKHPQGTEIKAITMHQMKILTPTTLTTEEGTVTRTSDLKEGGSVKEGFPFECYVLVDI